MFSHQKLDVYKLSIEFLKTVHELIRHVPNGNADVINQLRRAVMSVSLNIAEGAGKTGENDKKRFYAIARGSALECAALLDLLEAWELIRSELLATPRQALHGIVAMLSKLALKA